MAEGFAKAHGADVLEAQSAGIAPALAVVPLTHMVMLEKNIDLGDCYPKELNRLQTNVDLVVNMSGYELKLQNPVAMEEWYVDDPIGESEEVFREVRDEIERRVLRLIDILRSRKVVASETGSNAERVDSQGRPTRQ